MKLKLIRGVLLISTIFFSLLGIYKFYNNNMSGLTMRQAYLKAYPLATKFGKEIMLYSLTSVDIENKEDIFNGENGKRNNWNLDFAIPETNEHYIVQIQNGDIVNTTEVTGVKFNRENLISNEEILLDSKEALEIAKEQYHIVPGNEWAIGFHYTLKKENGISKQTVVAYDKNRNLCKININLQDKTVLSAQHKINIGGGLYDSNGTDLLGNRVTISNIALDEQTNVIAITGYEIKNDIEYEPILLFKSNTNEWKKYKTIDDILDIKLFKDCILVICKNKVELLDINTEMATPLLEGNIISARQSKNSEIILTDRNVFVYNPNKFKTIMQTDKSMITENSFALIDNDDKCYFYTNHTIYLIKDNELEKLIYIDAPIVDVLVDNGKAYIITQSKILIYDMDIKNKIFEKENSEGIIKLIKPEEDVIFALNGANNSFYVLKKVGDMWEIKKEKTLDKEFGILTDVNCKKTNELIYAFATNATWMDMPSERSNK